MESNFSNRDFEQFVKQNADQYRMFPSDKVWKGINNTLHTRRKWYGFWLAFLLLLTGGAVTWVMSSHPALKKQDAASLPNFNAFSPEPAAVSPEAAHQQIDDILPFRKQPFTAEDLAGTGTITNPSSAIRLVPEIITQLPEQPEASSANTFDRLVPPIMITRLPVANEELRTLAQQPVASAEPEPRPSTSPADQPVRTQSAPHAETMYPLSIESVLNSYQFKKAHKRISWQLFVTPTISYRRLTLNKSVDNAPPLGYPFASLSDVNSAVTHRPDLGLQIGLSGRYAITRNLKLRGGFQFNINRYDIKAYAFNGEVATIDLNGGSGGNGTISTWTNYRNFNGYRPNWLKNFYFSFSVPVGAELKLFGNNKTHVGVAGTVQPTYVLSDRAYLLSTDYKNYAEVPRLIRHVNLNTSFETFVSYHSGKTQWQVGPQVRYQVLSSFQSTYPVKENLFDFGLKVGLTLNK